MDKKEVLYRLKRAKAELEYVAMEFWQLPRNESAQKILKVEELDWLQSLLEDTKNLRDVLRSKVLKPLEKRAG